jgi:hypothetical protein
MFISRMLAFQWAWFVKKKVEHLFTSTCMYWSLYILGLRSSWGTSRACPAWSPPGYILTPALSPFFRIPTLEAMLPQRRLFIVLMRAAHISPTSFPSNCPLLAYWTSYFSKITHKHILYVHHTYIHTSHIMLQYITQCTHIYLVSSFLPRYVAGWLLSIHCVRYTYT